MKDFIKKRPLAALTVMILFLVFISVLYQFLFVDTRTKRLRGAVDDSDLVKYESYISRKVCDRTIQHGLYYFIFDNYDGGGYFEFEGSTSELDVFEIDDHTMMQKKKNDSIIKLTNRKDTLTIIFNLDHNKSFLINGKVRGR